jgi:hypothetical protein
VLVGGGDTDDVPLGEGDALAEAESLADADALAEADADALADADAEVLGDPAGAVALVLNVPSAFAVTKRDWTNVGVPLATDPVKHSTAHSSVPGDDWPMPFVARRAPTFPSKRPPNGAVTASTMFEILEILFPDRSNSTTTADPWLLAGHAVVVCHFGVELSAPLVTTEPETVSCSWPGADPTAASANPAVSRPAPPAMPTSPRSRVARRTVQAVRHLAVAPRTVPETF